ncbi:unnamed protein product, partial [Effrenium voratum]
EAEKLGVVWRGNASEQSSHELLGDVEMPSEFTWCDKGAGVDINLAVQHLLNCGGVGTCRGGTVDGPYQWLKAGDLA